MSYNSMWRAFLLVTFLSSALANIVEEPDVELFEEAEEKPQQNFEDRLNAYGTGPVKQDRHKQTDLDMDVMSHVHSVPIEEEEALNGGYIFDVDDNNRNPNQRCYVRNQGADKTKMPDNIENSIVDAQGQLDQDGTNRAQWAKCLPPPMYTLLSVESFAEGDIYNGRYEKRMRNATDFYATLKWLHNEACSHIRLRLENTVMLEGIREEVNFRSKLGMGYRIKTALMPIIKQIVAQYHSVNGNINPANAKTLTLIKNAMGPLKQALRIAQMSSMVTLENGENGPASRRRETLSSKSAKELLDPLYNNVMKFDVTEMEKFLASRPGPLDDMMTGNAKNGLGQPEVGSDGLPDALKNYGRCGKPLFDYAGYSLYTITISQNKEEQVTILTRDGWMLPDQVVAKSMNVPLRAVLPPDAYEVETKTTTYQDDLFASGNLACGNRADGLWTLTSYDRNSNENKVTATQEEGYFCIWMLNDLKVLPENQRAGFSNTEFIAESPSEMARVMNGNEENYKKYFPKPGEGYKYYHCHYSPRNSGSARVHSFQHQAERHYPGGIRQYCNCDWRRMGMIISRCDCTLDATANGGCRRAEMEMLNEHTQFDLWRKDGNKKVPARAALVHGDLAEGKIKSYTYENNRRRQPDGTPKDNENRYQEDTGRVRPTTDGNGGNNVVCSVNEAGVPDTGSRNFQRNKGNIQATSTIDPDVDDPNCESSTGSFHEEQFYFAQATAQPNLAGRKPTIKRVVSQSQFIQYATPGWSGFRSRNNFAVRWWATMKVDNTGYYYFVVEREGGAQLHIKKDASNWAALFTNYGNGNVNYMKKYKHDVRYHMPSTSQYVMKLEFFQRAGVDASLSFKFQTCPDYGYRCSADQRADLSWNDNLDAPCGNLPENGARGKSYERSFFSDTNGNGIMDYPECSVEDAAKKKCTTNGREFVLRDIYISSTTYSPAGGINYEFVMPDGQACDILNLKKECVPADAGNLKEGYLANYLAKFCDVPAALYQVPVDKDGTVPADFGAVTSPMPIMGYGQTNTNYRASAKAEFGALGHGTPLFCELKSKNPPQCANDGNLPMAVQGYFQGLEDESVYSSKQNDNVLKSKFYPAVGGSSNGNVPTAVNLKWTQSGTQASGNFNQDILTRYRASTNNGTMYAKDRVKMDSTRGEGVTCLNGKYVYARWTPDGSRPVVSTVREALNRNGPVASGQWACRYVGVHCNANNCNNNGNTEIAGPFVEPKLKAKKVDPIDPAPAPTPAPEVPVPAPTPEEDEATPAPAPAGRRRRRTGGSRRRRKGSRRRRKAAARFMQSEVHRHQ